MLRVKSSSSVLTKKTLNRYKEESKEMISFFDNIFNSLKVVCYVLGFFILIMIPTTF